MAFNSEEFGWNDHTAVAQGRPLVELTGIKFKESQEKANVYAKGKKPKARSRGNVTYEGEVKMLLSGLIALMRSHGNGKSINSIRPFDITSAFAVEFGAEVFTNFLKYVEFMDCEIDLSQGDTHVEVTLPIIIGDIEWNV